MTLFDQFRREKFKYFDFLPLKTVNFDTKIKIDHFPAVHEFVVFGQKMDIWHTVLSITRLIGSFLAQIHDDLRSSSVESVEVSAMFSI